MPNTEYFNKKCLARAPHRPHQSSEVTLTVCNQLGLIEPDLQRQYLENGQDFDTNMKAALGFSYHVGINIRNPHGHESMLAS